MLYFRRLSLLIFSLLFFCNTAFPQSFPPLIVEEEDGSPTGVTTKIKVTNGTLTRSGTTATIATGGGGSAYAQTVTVALSGGDYTTITAALAAISDASTTKRYLIKVMPGTYTESFTMIAFVDIDGSGANNTIITMADTTIITGISNSRLSNLTLSLTGATSAKQAYFINGSVALSNIYIENIDISMTGSTGDYGRGIQIFTSVTGINGLYINNCKITGTSTTRDQAIILGNSTTPAISNCYITNCVMTNSNYGIYLLSGTNLTSRSILVTIKNCYINAGNSDILLQALVNNNYIDVDSYNTNYLGSRIWLLSSAATRTVTVNSYGDNIKSVTKSAGGGTETFNSYGSTVGGIFTIGNGSTSAGVLQINEDTDDGINNATFTIPALAADTDYTLPPDDGDAGEQLQTNGAGVLTWEAAGGAGATAFDDIGDPDAATTVLFDNDEVVSLSTAEDTGAFLTLLSTDADLAGDTILLTLSFQQATDANQYYLQCKDNLADVPAIVFKIGTDGNTTIGGTLGVTGQITGDLTGNVTGNVSGSSGTCTAVDTEAEIEAITGAYFGASKVVTAGYIWVADGTDFESVPMSGEASIASGGAVTLADSVAVSSWNLTTPTITTSLTTSTPKTLSVAELDRLDGLAGVIVTDATACTDLEGVGLSIDTAVLKFTPSELESVTWGAGAAATIVHTYNVSGTDTTMTMGSALTTFSGGVTATGDLIVTGGDITLGTSSIFSGGDTASLNNIDATDATTENTVEALIFDADAETITGNWEVQDDVDFTFGNDANWGVQYDEAVDDQLLFLTAGTACAAITDPMFEIIVGATPTANQEVFGVSKGTQASNTALFTVDEDGDTVTTGSITSLGAGDSYFNEQVAIGQTSAAYLLDILGADNTTIMRIKNNANQAATTATDIFLSFDSTTGVEGNIAGTAVAGVIAYNTFTGSHWTKTEGEPKVGEVLEITNGSIENKQQLFTTKVCSTKNSKKALGVYGGTDNEGHDLVLSLGTGIIWLVNKGSDLEIGDILVSSNVRGCAEKAFLPYFCNRLAKVTQDVKWKPNEKRRLVKCIYLGG